MNRFASATVAVIAASLLSACVFAPPSGSNAIDAEALAKNSDRALIACGAGNVKEVSAKSFSCK